MSTISGPKGPCITISFNCFQVDLHTGEFTYSPVSNGWGYTDNTFLTIQVNKPLISILTENVMKKKGTSLYINLSLRRTEIFFPPGTTENVVKKKKALHYTLTCLLEEQKFSFHLEQPHGNIFDNFVKGTNSSNNTN